MTIDIVLNTEVSDFKGKYLYKEASSCSSLLEVLDFSQELYARNKREAVMAYGMLLSANLTEIGSSFYHSKEVLDNLGTGKYLLDDASSHAIESTKITSNILLKAQVYVDEVTIPCTEWVGSPDVISVVYNLTKHYLQKGDEDIL